MAAGTAAALVPIKSITMRSRNDKFEYLNGSDEPGPVCLKFLEQLQGIQRGKIQEESMYYEHRKHDGSLPLVGVNTFLPKEHAGEVATEIELIRSTEGEKAQQIANVRNWQTSRNGLAPEGETAHAHLIQDETVTGAHNGHGLAYLQDTARRRGNVFEALVEAVKTHSLGQISHALYDVGGEYRRNM